jgi:hypothetical protein
MNTPQEPMDEQLTRAYRRASEAESGLPSDATRAAVFAQARATAMQRLQPANDARYRWRAVAGIAVVGIAVLIWRQADHRVPGSVTHVAPSSQVPPKPAAELAPAPASASASASMAQADVSAVDKQATRAESLEPALAREPDQESGPAAPSESAPSPAMASQASVGAAMADAATPTPLQRYFPEAYQSTAPPPMLWLVLDAADNVVRSGSRDTVVDWSDINAEVTALLDGRSPGPWRISSVRNAQNQSIMLGIAQLP